MKKLTTLCMAFFAVLVVTSCNKMKNTFGFFPDMDSKEAVEAAKDLVKDNVKSDEWKILSVRMGEQGCDQLTNKFDNVSVTMLNKSGQAFSQTFFIKSTQDPTSLDPETIDIPDPQPLDLDKVLDPNVVLKNIETAKKMVPKEFVFRSMSSYEVTSLNKYNLGTIVLNVVEADESKRTQSNAGRKTEVFYQLIFTMEKDGSIRCRDLEDYADAQAEGEVTE